MSKMSSFDGKTWYNEKAWKILEQKNACNNCDEDFNKFPNPCQYCSFNQKPNNYE